MSYTPSTEDADGRSVERDRPVPRRLRLPPTDDASGAAEAPAVAVAEGATPAAHVAAAPAEAAPAAAIETPVRDGKFEFSVIEQSNPCRCAT